MVDPAEGDVGVVPHGHDEDFHIQGHVGRWVAECLQGPQEGEHPGVRVEPAADQQAHVHPPAEGCHPQRRVQHRPVAGGVSEACGGEVLHHRGVEELPGSPHDRQQRVQVTGAAVGAESGRRRREVGGGGHPVKVVPAVRWRLPLSAMW